MYPLYYYKEDTEHVNPIKVFVSDSKVKKELSDNLEFILSRSLTKHQYILNVVISPNEDSFVSNKYFFNQTGRITIKAVYNIQKLPFKKSIYKGKTYITSLFDFSSQSFYKSRVIKDANTKSVNELAENIGLDVISFIKSID